MNNTLKNRLQYHVTGAIERGEAQAIVEKTTLHTPAPWKHAKRGDYDTHGIGIFANNEAGLPYYVATAGFMGTADHRYAEANARLISSAPDLLSALDWALRQIEDDLDPDHQAAFDAAHSTLRKAKGEA